MTISVTLREDPQNKGLHLASKQAKFIWACLKQLIMWEGN